MLACLNPENRFAYVFLDVDGVLNSTRFYEKRNADRAAAAKTEPIDPEAIRRLQRIVDAKSAVNRQTRLVVSSTWRLGQSCASMSRLFERHGLANAKIVGLTPEFRFTGSQRGHEIEHYLVSLPWAKRPRSFVILDDDADMGALAHRLVRTDLSVGLTEDDVDLVLQLIDDPALTVKDARIGRALARGDRQALHDIHNHEARREAPE